MMINDGDIILIEVLRIVPNLFRTTDWKEFGEKDRIIAIKYCVW